MQPADRVDFRKSLRHTVVKLNRVHGHGFERFSGRFQQKHERHLGQIDRLLSQNYRVFDFGV